jgi:putative restriction endonuclease
VLANYEYQCCVCRLKQPKLLEAAHIVDWSDTDDPSLRINPRNGMAMCAIHHKAFDQKLITIEPDDKIILLSSEIKEENSPGAKYLFHCFENSSIFIPEKFKPHEEFLRIVSR